MTQPGQPPIVELPMTPEEEKTMGVKSGSSSFAEIAEQVQKGREQAQDLQDEGIEPKDDESSPLPDWALPLPAEVKLPKGRQVYVMRFRAKLTETPKQGDRYCIMWSLTEADEKLAYRRTRGESTMAMNELSKQMIRVLGFVRTDASGKESAEGAMVDWTNSPGLGNIARFWDAIGARCRSQVKNAYAKLHTMEVGDVVDFFTKCVAVRTVSG
jgi:hypothetical protein